VVRRIGKLLAGSLAPTGEIIRQARKLFAGVVTPAASLAVGRIVVKAMSGSVALAGSVVKTIGRVLGGVIGWVGSLIRELLGVGLQVDGTVEFHIYLTEAVSSRMALVESVHVSIAGGDFVSARRSLNEDV
jgi:hypothetical protein